MRSHPYHISQFILPLCLVCLALLCSLPVEAKNPPWLPRKGKPQRETRFRSDCAPSKSEIDMSINNVRARLLGGGDVWWDLNTAKYIVPKVEPGSGLDEVSSIFAGAVWLGGFDPEGNLKLAAQTNRSANRNDFWPGPLNPETGTIDRQTCAQWDQHFRVYGENIRQFLSDFRAAEANGEQLSKDDIPEDVLGWPARGNPYFEGIYGFSLPNTTQGLAAFYDQNEDMIYNPIDGDYPIIEIRGCPLPQYPDEMIFWIYNDAGSIHSQSQGLPIQMEVQVQAFAYATNDEVNNMTFQRYKLINRATESINDTYFAMFVDPDLGCHQDDYVGCDTLRSLAYVYNEDQVDGITGCDCEGTPTYCEHVPILGIDYFRGPLDENGNEIGMSSFTYFNNRGIGEWPNAQTDPEVAQEYYNYMSGRWKDGTPFSHGGTSYNPGQPANKYAFTEAPNDNNGWSMCTAGLPFGDRRTIQASGPFRLDPGAVNELIIGVVWVPDLTDYPCPSIEPLIFADETAQALFDNCFDITDGPDAPDMDLIELENEIIFILSNEESSNNYEEAYHEIDLRAPTDLSEEEKQYVFEGYKVFQTIGPNVSGKDLEDPEKAKLVFQTDLKNGISQMVNWRPIPHPTRQGQFIYEPVIKVIGKDKGVQHSFKITEDQFAKTDRKLVNHKKYYFRAVAYAHNEFAPFDEKANTGQKNPYLEGRRNVRSYTAIPRPITYNALNANYGDGLPVSRIEGKGAGNNYLKVSKEMREQMLGDDFDGKITYENGYGPLNVRIINPLEVSEGAYLLGFYDSNLSDDKLDEESYWYLIDKENLKDTLFAERSLAELNEQIFGSLGFSISIGQTADVGDRNQPNFGAIGGEVIFEDKNSPWLGFVADDALRPLNYVATDPMEPDFELDPEKHLSTSFNGWVPFYLADFRNRDRAYITPSWYGGEENMDVVRKRFSLADLNNVDIVFTNDKSKWSRCVVVETANQLYYKSLDSGGAGHNTVEETESFDLRKSPSVGKDDADGDGIADPDGDGYGMSWFPGYAVDVETGERLNIFFGENSIYNKDYFEFFGPDGAALGEDMMWNPDNRFTLQLSVPDISALHLGGQHFIYVTNQPYDGCQELRTRLDADAIFIKKFNGLRDVTWTAIPVTNGQLLSYRDGLIPNETVVELRVDNPYSVAVNNGDNNGHPLYEFELKGVAAEDLIEAKQEDLLSGVNVVPNPYLAYNSYETSQFSDIVKITNLPPKCEVTIYSLDGKFIRQYKRNVGPVSVDRKNAGVRYAQPVPDIEWDLKNSRGVPVASGMYLIHINGFELGERTIKWFGIHRKFDPSGL